VENINPNQQSSQALQLQNPLNTNLTNQRVLTLGASSSNLAPILIDTALSLPAVNEDAVSPIDGEATFGNSVASIASFSTNVTDANNPGAFTGIAITSYNADLATTKGNLWYTINNGATWDKVKSSITEDKSFLLAADQNTRIYFQPIPDYFGTIDSAFTFRAWDTTTGTNGEMNVDTSGSNNGGTTAFSTATDSVSLRVNGVNDAPVNTVPITTLLDPIRINEDGEIVFSESNAISVSDIDAGTSSIKVTLTTTGGILTLNNAANTGVTTTGNKSGSLSLVGSQSSINSAISGLKFNPTLDESGNFSIVVVSNDQTNILPDEATSTIYVKVAPVNDTPSFVGGSNQEVIEDVGSQSVVWATKISEGAANESEEILNFIVTTDNDTLFDGPVTIDPETGTLSYKTAKDANGIANVSVRLRDDGDGANTSAEQKFTITIREDNDAPVNTIPTTIQTIDEDKQLVFSSKNPISITDIDAGSDIMQVTLTAENGRLKLASNAELTSFRGDNSRNLIITGTQTSINNALKDLTFTPTTNFNGETKITVLTNDQSTRGGGLRQTMSTINIKVDSINDAPTFDIGSTLEIREDAPAQTVKGWATNISKGASDESSQSLEFIVDADKKELFTLDGQPKIATDGTLTYKVAENANNSTTVSVKLKDNGDGTNTSVEKKFTIDITPVNDSPVNTVAKTTQVIDEDNPLVFSVENKNLISISDIDAQSSEVEVTLKAKNGNITLSGQDKLSDITDDGTSTVTLIGTVDDINTDLENLTFQPAENFNGNTSIEIITNDKGNTGDGINVVELKDSDIISIEVKPVNDAPTFTKGSNLEAAEDEQPQVIPGWATQISAGAKNESSQTLEFTVTNDHSKVFTVQPKIDAKTGNLIFQAADNLNDTTVVTVTAELKDNGGTTTNIGDKDTSKAQNFIITVKPTNDAPITNVPITEQPIKEDGSLIFSTTNSNLISISDADTSANSLQVTITAVDGTLTASNNSTITPTGDGTGNLTLSGSLDEINVALDGLKFAPTANFNGKTKITIVTTEQGINSTNNINIDVAPVNDAPTVIPGANVTAFAGTAKQTKLSWAKFSNEPADELGQTALEYIISSNNNPELFKVAPAIDNMGNLTFTPAATVTETTIATIGVQVKDNGGTDNNGVDISAEKTFTITVNPLLVNISTATAFVNEGNSNTSEYNFTVSLSGSSTETVVVNYTTADGTATTADKDYVLNSGVLSFEPGQTSKTVKVLVVGDTKYEADQTFKVNLSSADKAILGNAMAVGTIKNDDKQPVISIADVNKKESDSGTKPFTFNVNLSNASEEKVTVDYSVVNGTATSADYEIPSNTVVTFAPGETTQTITVDVKGDTDIEVNETFQVSLSNPSNATIQTNDGMAVGTIINDDGTKNVNFNGDENQDLVWRNETTGENAVWLVNGKNQEISFIPSQNEGWEIAATTDFTGDGKSDLLWRNYRTGENTIWEMNGKTRTNIFNLETVGDIYINWEIIGAADFNGDRKADILWRNSQTGENHIWQMDGTAFVKGNSLTQVSREWRIEQVGDFNGDRTHDLFWRNYLTGQNAVWLMNQDYTFKLELPPAVDEMAWEVKGISDFNNDGKMDVVWRNQVTGINVIWQMNSGALDKLVFLPELKDQNWTIAQVTDFTSDGKPDIVWRNYASGENMVWQMDGTFYQETLLLPKIDILAWQIA
jgi:Calx-beta domain/FG-GAP-like repeat